MRFQILALIFAMTVLASSVFADGPSVIESPGNLKLFQEKHENIALNKKYTFNHPPNYDLTRHTGDSKHLTDGEKLSRGRFWNRSTTVGWAKTNPVIIEIDLEATVPISGLLYNTAAGVAGVRWPWAILIFVSNDAEEFRYVGDLVELDQSGGLPDPGVYRIHSFWTDQLEAEGRYVRIKVIPNGRYTFVDEIEIYKGQQPGTASIPSMAAGDPPVDISQRFIENKRWNAGVRHRLASDLKTIKALSGGVGKWPDIQNILKGLEEEISAPAKIEANGFSTLFPINNLHRRLFGLQARIWRAKGLKEITLWQSNRWDMLRPTDMPLDQAPRVGVTMMKNEYRSAAFNITNAGDQTATLTLSIKDLPGGTDPAYIEVRAGVFTDTAAGTPVMAALPAADKVNGSYVVQIEPGLTRQVWLTFSSKDLKAGTYNGRIEINRNGMEIPITLKVYPLRFPDRPALHVGGWDYTHSEYQYEVTPLNRGALIEHLRQRHVDTPWATRAVLKTGKYDSSGTMIETPDTQSFKMWIQRWPDARNYYVYVNAQEHFGGFKMGTAPFNKAVADWIDFWVNTLADWDIKAEQLGLLLVDEPSTVEASNTAIQHAKAIKTVQPGVVIFETLDMKTPWEAPRELFEYSDVLCIELSNWIDADRRFLAFYADQKRAGRKIWFYSAKGPGKLLDPYAYHRLQQWFSWQQDAQGSFFWSFSDSNGASSWNEYLAHDQGSYTPFFLDADSVTVGKHMEAIREGIQDYEYLRMLRDRIHELEKQAKSADAIDAAKDLLASAANRVTRDVDRSAKLRWTVAKNRDTADQVVEEILEALLSLEGM
jgi:hypothetical protein